MVVAIHQPNFFPWLGYFNKIARADVFILLDNVQFPKSGGTWMNRVRIVINGRPAWITMPVHRNYSGVKPLKDICINQEVSWKLKILKTVEQNYRRAPYFRTIFPFLEQQIQMQQHTLLEFNIQTLRSLMACLELSSTQVVFGSSLGETGTGTDRLIEMVKAVGGNTYMCGGGASGYQEDHKFAEAGLRLEYQKFYPTCYRQFNTTSFVPGLSVIDVLMNCGWDQTSSLIQDNVLSHNI